MRPRSPEGVIGAKNPFLMGLDRALERGEAESSHIIQYMKLRELAIHFYVYLFFINCCSDE